MVRGGTARARVELRDVSQAGQASAPLAAVNLKALPLAPGARIPFVLWAPEAEPAHALSLRAQLDGEGSAEPAVYLTTQNCPVANTGHVEAVEVPLTKV
jgi:hypothetical protein